MRAPPYGLIFVVYCLEAGIALAYAPWTGFWDLCWSSAPLAAVQHLALHPLARAVVSGFGGVHLVWGLHDLQLILARRRRRTAAP